MTKNQRRPAMESATALISLSLSLAATWAIGRLLARPPSRDRFNCAPLDLACWAARRGGCGGPAVGEQIQLRHRVFGMLARQTGVLRRNARAVRAVAAGAGRDLALGNAAAVD